MGVGVGGGNIILIRQFEDSSFNLVFIFKSSPSPCNPGLHPSLCKALTHLNKKCFESNFIRFESEYYGFRAQS